METASNLMSLKDGILKKPKRIQFQPNYKSFFTQPEECLCIYKGYEIRNF